MKPHKTLAIGALVLALAGMASADSARHHAGYGAHSDGADHDMMEMMTRMHGMMGAGGAMPGMGMMGGQMGMSPQIGMMGPGGSMMGGMPGMAMMSALDADGDGTVTAEEARSGLGDLLTEYDADGDGTLSIEEFETLHSALIRETMVDRFQHLDADGDGAVTPDEMQAPTLRIERMQAMRERMMDQYGDAPEQMRPGQGHMMDGSGPHMQDN